MITNFKVFESYVEKFKLGDRVYYCPLGELGPNGAYIVVGTKKPRRKIESQQIMAKNEKTELYKNKYFDQDTGFNKEDNWIESYKFISEDEYNTMKYNI